MRLSIGLIIITFCLFLSPVQAQAQQVFSDQFDTNLDQWQPTRDNGQYWQIKNSQLEAYMDMPSRITELVPKDDFWPAPKNYLFTVDVTPLQGSDKNLSFRFIDLNNWYEAHFLNTFVNLVGVKDGLGTSFNIFEDVDFDLGKTYHVQILVFNNHISLAVNNRIIFSGTDWVNENMGGKIGLKLGTGADWPAKVIFDNVKVIALPTSSDLLLPISPLLQTDPAWASFEYDLASSWAAKYDSSPNINRWGCAITSTAMLLNWYGINLLPNNQVITPASLNAWLQTQPDGYLGEGMVNWIAITRLTKEMSGLLGTPTLEYQRLATDWVTSAKQDLLAGRPSILNLPEHFVILNGFKNNVASIIDPLIGPKQLDWSQVLSTRQFSPTHSDLSYLLVVMPASTQIQTSNTHSPNIHLERNWQVLEIKQPSLGQYTFSIFNPADSQLGQVISYSPAGQPIIHQVSLPATSQIHLTLNYDGNTSSISLSSEKIDLAEKVQEIIDLLDQGWLNKQITKHYAYDYLKQILLHAKENHGHIRYQQLWTNSLQNFSKYIEPVLMAQLTRPELIY